MTPSSRLSIGYIVTMTCLSAQQWMPTEGAKILLSPVGTICSSRLRNMQKLGHILAAEGHDVHLIFPENCEFLRQRDRQGKLVHIDVVLSSEASALPSREFTDRLLNASIAQILDMLQSANVMYCESVLQQGLVDRLSRENYDLGIFDIMDWVGVLLIQHLNIPVMWYSNFGYMEHPRLTFPTPVSYYPMVTSTFTNHMTFLQRVRNFIELGVRIVLSDYKLYPAMSSVAEKYGYKLHKSLNQIGPEIAAYLVNTNNAFEYPRAILPNVVMIGGIFSTPPKPLPQELEDFIQGSEHGVIVVAFGTLDFTMPPHTANSFARVFSKLEQRVIWKYSGEEPKGLGSNTLLQPWLPQNDLLGHSKMKLFVSHCGVSSTHEAAYHDVPIVAVPILADQFHNANKLVIRSGIGQQINFWNFTEMDLSRTISEVLNNVTYRQNAKLLSRRYVDQPIPPKDLFLYWVERVSKNGIPEHLQPRAAWELSWAQYFLLDVTTFIAGVMVTVLLLGFLLLKFTLTCCCYAFKKVKVD